MSFTLSLIEGERAVALAPLPHGNVDADVFKTLPSCVRADKTLVLLCEADDFNRRHLNVRLTSLEQPPCHTVLTEHSRQIATNTYRIEFTDIHVDDGLVLQAFYRNRWYGLFLGDASDPRYRRMVAESAR